MIKGKYGIDACNVGDEGGFAPNISRQEVSPSLECCPFNSFFEELTFCTADTDVVFCSQSMQ